MTGREFLELDSPQKRLILERFKRMEIIQKMFNELPQADQSKLLAKQTAGSNTGPSHTENIILRNMLIRGPLMKFSLTAVTGKKIVATASQPFCHFTLEVCVNSGRNLCNHGKYFLAANSSLCGLAANNFFRSILHIRKAALVSAMPMAVIPFLSTAAVYEAFVHDPLFSGQLNCEVCAVIRGGLVGAVVGGFYPIFLAIPLNGSLAARYMSAPLPGKENVLRYWITTAQPVFRKMSVGILVQALTGLYLATKQHGIYIKMLLQMNSSRDPEELPE